MRKGYRMTYSDFTLEMVERAFGVTVQPAALFPSLAPLQAPLWLQELLAKGRQLALISDKAHDETELRLDSARYYIDNVEGILAVFQAIINAFRRSENAPGERSGIIAVEETVMASVTLPRLKAGGLLASTRDADRGQSDTLSASVLPLRMPCGEGS